MKITKSLGKRASSDRLLCIQQNLAWAMNKANNQPKYLWYEHDEKSIRDDCNVFSTGVNLHRMIAQLLQQANKLFSLIFIKTRKYLLEILTMSSIRVPNQFESGFG